VSDILPTYTKYIALISQASNNAPTVIELENTIGPIVWTRTAVGTYRGTLTGAFTNNKTTVMISQVEWDRIVMGVRLNNNAISIETTDLDAANYQDASLLNNTLEIRVYE